MAANGGAAAPSPSALLPRRVEWTRKRSAPDEAAPCAISLLQFNVLADGLSGRSPTLGDFTRPPAAVMDWAYRGPLLVEEMLRHEADVITAQEVDHFSDYFVPRLARAGYAGMFHKKPDSPCRSVCELEDGCALWYKRSRLELVGYVAFQYVDRTKEDPVVLNQGAQIALLRVLATGQLLLVANTHLKASKNAAGEAVRAIQVQQLLDAVAEQKAQAEAAHSVAAIPFLVAGDFNATPTEDEGGDACFRACVDHSLGVQSAYPTTLEQPALYTTWKIRSKGARGVPPEASSSPGSSPPPAQESDKCNYIDYIWYGGGLGPPAGRLAIPDGDAIGTDRLPSAAWPSDHLSLLAVFTLEAKDSPEAARHKV